MNFEKVRKRNRKAISPVLATVILIAITLIAAIAIAGFVFGLFGSFTSSAQVSAQVTTCTHGTGGNTSAWCIVTLTNSGTSNAAANGCSLNVNGVATVGTLTGAAKNSIQASSSATGDCRVTSAAQTVGSQAVGSFSLSNGASVPFSGTWS
ncbi:MAG TPA: archaellin/type IV pilin N-terminal domain-containing protein [Nitrososphaerales archaeon]|nr:archaellin/type IV pilin N-terminal domain-containing protein [Nitrososphaerales archaeon]